jgi:hypothetical protein
MPQKSKARASAGKVKSKSCSPRAPQKSQSERFIEAARAIGVDETGQEFEKTLRLIVKSKKGES